MALATYGRVFFPIIRETAEIQGGVKKTAIIGYFSTIESTARFLGLEALAASEATLLITRRKAGKRTAVRLDGSSVNASTSDKNEGGSTTTIASETSDVLASSGGKGSKTVRLKSGKLIDAGKRNTFTCSFRFPGFCTNLIISNALADVIPSGKIAATGAVVSEEQLYPYFISAGGKRYPIATKQAAKADTAVVVVPSSAAELSSALPSTEESERAQ